MHVHSALSTPQHGAWSASAACGHGVCSKPCIPIPHAPLCAPAGRRPAPHHRRLLEPGGHGARAAGRGCRRKRAKHGEIRVTCRNAPPLSGIFPGTRLEGRKRETTPCLPVWPGAWHCCFGHRNLKSRFAPRPIRSQLRTQLRCAALATGQGFRQSRVSVVRGESGGSGFFLDLRACTGVDTRRQVEAATACVLFTVGVL